MTEDVELDGLVVREIKTGEADKLLTLLTATRGKLPVSGKGALSLKSRYAGATQMFAYGTFLLRHRGNYWTIRDAAIRDCFMNLRYDVEKLALANYICDVAADVAQEEEDSRELLQLTLNTLHAVANLDRIPPELVKGAFEFRLAVTEGYMPDLTGCAVCGKPITEDCRLDVMNGRLLCKTCAKLLPGEETVGEMGEARILIRATPSTVAAMRYIGSAPPAKLLSFTLDESERSLFAVLCERYLLNHLEHGYSSLEYYKKLRQDLKRT